MEQHYRLTLADAIAKYQAGDLTAKGLVHFYILIRCKPGWKIRLEHQKICQLLGIGRTAFYNAISRLKDEGSINWEAPQGILVSLSISESFRECGMDSASADTESTIAEIESTIAECDSASAESKAPEALQDLGFEETPDFNSDCFHLKQQQEPVIASNEQPEQVEEIINELKSIKCTPNLQINEQVMQAVMDFLANAKDAIAYLRECLKTWDGRRTWNWTGVFVKALKEGTKPSFPSGAFGSSGGFQIPDAPIELLDWYSNAGPNFDIFYSELRHSWMAVQKPFGQPMYWQEAISFYQGDAREE